MLLRGRGLSTLATGEQPRCRFGNEQVFATLSDGGRSARCISPRVAGAGVHPLSISLNSENYSSNDWTQPVQFVYTDAHVASVRPVRGGAHQPRFALQGSGLALGARAADVSAFTAPMEEVPLSLGDAATNLSPLLASLERLTAPIVPTTRAAASYDAEAPAVGRVLLLADASCRIVALQMHSTPEGTPRAELMSAEAHGAIGVGSALMEAGERLCAPALGDLDGDGYADLIVGVGSGLLRAYRNLANASMPDPTYVPWSEETSADPLGGAGMSRPVNGSARPFLVDVDGDGDLDLFVGCGGCGGGGAALAFFRNQGTPRRAVFVHAPDDHHPLAEAAALHFPIEEQQELTANETRAPLPAPPLAFGDVDGNGRPEAMLGGALLHLISTSAGTREHVEVDAHGRRLAEGDAEESSGEDMIFGVPRLPSEYALPDPLVDLAVEPSEQLAVIDLDGDGDNDLILLRADGGGARIAMSVARDEFSRLLKCKFGGSFEDRDCWSCGSDAAAAHQVPARPLLQDGSDEKGGSDGSDEKDGSDGSEAFLCVPPPLDGWSKRPRVYAGNLRVELTFNDQQWTHSLRQFEYVTPWSAVAVYPTAGPTLGGTFVQVIGVGLYAAATAEANPVMWRLGFVAHDQNSDAHLDVAELDGLIEEMRADGALPEEVRENSLSARELLAAHDADSDGLLSFDEYLGARPGGMLNESSPFPALPSSWSPRCGFGPTYASGLAGWTADSLTTVVASARSHEWVGCHSPPATSARADARLRQSFEAGGSLDGWRLLRVARLPYSPGEARPTPQDVTHGLYSIVRVRLPTEHSPRMHSIDPWRHACSDLISTHATSGRRSRAHTR